MIGGCDVRRRWCPERLLASAGFALASAIGLAAAGPASGSEIASAPVENHALVIGVNRYRDAPPLQHAVSDATRLAETLDAAGYAVRLMTDFEAEPADILAHVRAVAEVMDAGEGRARGNLVFAFSGHGFSRDGVNYLATSRTVLADLDATALSLPRLERELSASGIGRQVLFVDACRNDPGKGEIDVERRFVIDEEAAGRAILYSTGPGELSWEDSDLGHGVFSHFLAEGLGGAAADARGDITFDALYRHVRREVAHHVYEKYERVQVPYIAGERTGEFVIASVAPAGSARGDTSEAVSAFGGVPTRADEPIRTGAPAAPVEAPSAMRASVRRWATVGAVLGVVALGVLAAGEGGSSDDDGEASLVTLVVPTP